MSTLNFTALPIEPPASDPNNPLLTPYVPGNPAPAPVNYVLPEGAPAELATLPLYQQEQYMQHSAIVGLCDTVAKIKLHFDMVAEAKANQAKLQAQLNKETRTATDRERDRLAKAEARGQKQAVVEAARKAWRDAVAERDNHKRMMDIKVAKLHQKFIEARSAAMLP